jgi:predicted signal transduction protein with EAL and GGDEF domain
MLDRIADVDDVAGVVEKLRGAARGPFEVGDVRTQVSFSIGVAVFPSDAGDAEALLGHADAALYRAKEAGPDEVAYYTKALNARLHDRVRIDAALREGLAADELRLVYQPRVDMAGGRIVSLEALARWTSPRLGEVPPGRFIPVAEASGFISVLGRWVVRTAVARIAAFRDGGVPVVPIAVNVSARQFREPDLVDAIRDTLAEYDVPAGLFEVELTESVFMSDTVGLVDRVRALERLGVAVSIDDFGTAFSSLGRLKRLGVQSLKIDQGFVRDLGDDPEAAPNDAAIARAVIALGDAMDLTVIAEGVETPAQRDFLLRHGCRIAQGYLFARPAEVAEVEAMLRAGRVAGASARGRRA